VVEVVVVVVLVLVVVICEDPKLGLCNSTAILDRGNYT